VRFGSVDSVSATKQSVEIYLGNVELCCVWRLCSLHGKLMWQKTDWDWLIWTTINAYMTH